MAEHWRESCPGDAILGVERSLLGQRWRDRTGDERAGLAIAQRLGEPEIVGRLLARRGVEPDAASAFLNPLLRDCLPDPSTFKDMDRAVARLVEAIEARQGIAIFGDYDVDGATSAALLRRFFKALGIVADLYVPDRQREGYGPNAAALLKLRARGARVVVTVDCGTTADHALAAAAEAGLDVIVVDHHVSGPALPRALAIVNPNRLDETVPHRTFAAVGLAFLLAVGINRALRRIGWYRARPEPDLLSLLDLVALGTVADVVPLTGVNRALVAQGLKVMRRRSNAGIAALADVAKVSEPLDAYHAGFILGPRVNAGGRVGAADLGARLLSTDDPGEARALAEQLQALNAERREIEALVLAQAVAQTEAEPRRALVFAAGEGWHPGVIGIVASRLKDRYGRPACVVAMDGPVARGSARSVAGFALGPAILAAHQAGLLIHGGGHAMAAGFTVAADRLLELRDFLATQIGAALGEGEPVPELAIDGALSASAATPDLAAVLERIGPFGSGNPEPRFVLPQMRILRAEVVGEVHIRLVLGDGAGGGRIKAMAFRAIDDARAPAFLRHDGAPWHIAGHVRADRWQGREGVKLLVDDAAPAV
ncbi:MAG: single-stranded-DNA-specific exonuclease RecJ [Stellaceae bacterium]